MNITIIDCGSGNLRSAQKAFEKVSKNLFKKTNVIVSASVEDLEKTNFIVLPGVGSFSDFIKGINDINGMQDALNYYVIKKGLPFLGICVGMQVLATKGYENIETEGLNWISGSVRKIKTHSNLPVPQMGWNNLVLKQNHPIVSNISNNDHAYFVHSYFFDCNENSHIVAQVDYGIPINAIVVKDNIIGMQFHPEKSQQTGLDLISNFLLWGK
ncbi:MAG: imidazole glycerol phosphate synthase subunit HisH [Rhodospirillaceae bacterium]|nr:imidazole glycerol phosphate synthase subunit HisH [Rhodospirillaceae bacterium]|tara:strand:+ start:37 stop:675 length:639 start_codon:yes stop_codon:yes gene_type:complete